MEHSRELDVCFYWHNSVEMRCGGLRKGHEQKYPHHPFMEKSSVSDEDEKTRREIAAAFAEKWNVYANPVDAVDLLLKCRDERAAKIADERAAFNLRMAQTFKIGDPMADLKHTRADEASIIAGEIRGLK